MTDRPDFLFIMTDQHRADWLGCYGHPVVRTPNIDAIAAEGTRFDQFFVATPVCMPNRASFMTGRYPSVHGLRYNGCLLSRRANTFVDVLRAAGYRTAAIGKSHLQPFTDSEPFARDPFETGPIEEAWKPDGLDYTVEEPARYSDGDRFEVPTPYYGFDHVDMVTGHGDKAGGHYRQWFRETYPDWQELTDPANELPHNYTCPQAFRTPIPEDAYPTAYIRDRAAAYLKDNADSAAPLYTFVSFPDPHHPFNPPGRYWDMYDPDDFELSVRYEDHENPPPPLAHARREYEAGRMPKVRQISFMASDDHIREAMALSAGMVTMIDDAVGAIVDALKASGRYENTVIVFNSDHGDYLGDFNLMLKGAWPKDAITRVPMIWSDPSRRQGTATQALASTVDLAPTILERAGVRPYFGMQGESFSSALGGGPGERDSVFIEYNDGGKRMGFDPPARVRTLVTPDWHLSVYKDLDWGELYDRRADPHHLRNLWSSPAHADVKAALIQSLTHALIAQMDESPRSKRLA
ncbi:sulfatase-like hydrolase/transferase [Psychromarinibacter sp. C21-152]|uniref:Sulfatase-like hydrolase/transferase n=1 Tax=Psychromarinibacter sediminicola TaxID=3033385 RepID=A0AAE3T8A8_9RHOB|nr:sulfatase-like hydrolase/transferase [Psychromarinibacter sediminicola]MDF0601220.1 sulfatase-like hydrolase/transferase [Psychromarinibacter sediminicola]